MKKTVILGNCSSYNTIMLLRCILVVHLDQFKTSQNGGVKCYDCPILTKN